jgi:hypothetical protein
MGADEEGTHERLKAHRRELIDQKTHPMRRSRISADSSVAEANARSSMPLPSSRRVATA